MTTNIMIVGIGGQGSILIGKILGYVLMEKGYDIKISETHGMSQRGGRVLTNVKFGNKVYSPLIDKGEADYIIALEMLESISSIEFLKSDGMILINDNKVSPNYLLESEKKQIMNLEKEITSLKIRSKILDANKKAEEAGAVIAANLVMLGCLSAYLKEIKEEEWVQAIGQYIPKKYTEINKKAFLLGRKC